MNIQNSKTISRSVFDKKKFIEQTKLQYEIFTEYIILKCGSSPLVTRNTTLAK